MTSLFLKNGVPSVKWRDSKGKTHTVSEKSYTRNFHADHDLEEKVDKLQNKEKKVDEIANSNEELIEQKEKELKDKENESIRSLTAEEKDEMITKLKAELEDLKDNLKRDKEEAKINKEFLGANNHEAKGTYSVIKFDNNYINREGDELLLSLGSSV